MTHLFDPTLGLVSHRKPLNSLRLMSDYFHPTPAFNTLKDTLKTVHPAEYKLDWAAQNAKQRSERYRLNAWAHLSPLLKKANDLELASDAGVKKSSASRPRLLRRFVLNWMLDWERQNPFDRHDPQGNGQDNPFAWYDMAVGLRAAVIGHMLALRSAGKIKISRPEYKRLLSCARSHLAYLRDPALWASHSNHGFYQSIGFFALVKSAPLTTDRPSEDEELALGRLRDYLETCVSDDGVHLEHSPAYHLFVLKTLRTLSPLLGDKTETESLVAHILHKMEIAKEAMVTVEGLLLPFGDSNFGSVSQPRDIDEPELLASFQAGLGVFKASQADSGETHYFATSAWHHSSVHKQLDDGGCVWFENGVPILIDPGRFGFRGQTDADSELRERGFFYDDPRRVFVESAHAHNTIEINGQTDNRRQAKPYGSGLVAAKILSDGAALFEIDIIREAGAYHRRTWVYKPGHLLLCVDFVEPLVKDQAMTVDQWWQIDPIWAVSLDAARRRVLGNIDGDYANKATDGNIEAIKASMFRAGLSKVDLEKKQAFLPVSIAPDEVSDRGLNVMHSIAGERGETLEYELSIYQGEVNEAGRLQGWTSRRPEQFEAAPAIRVRAETGGDPLYIATIFSLDAALKDLSIDIGENNEISVFWSTDLGEPSQLDLKYQDDDILVHQNGVSEKPIERLFSPMNTASQHAYRSSVSNKVSPRNRNSREEGLTRLRELQVSSKAIRSEAEKQNILEELAGLERAGIRSAAKLSGDILSIDPATEADQLRAIQAYYRAAKKGHEGATEILLKHQTDALMPKEVKSWLALLSSQKI